MTNDQTRTANMTPYVIQFIFIWAALTVAAVAFVYQFDLDAPSATSIIITLAVAAGVGASFARKEGRAMSKAERRILANLSSAITFILGIAGYVALFMLLSGLSLVDLVLVFTAPGVPIWIFLLIGLAALLLNWATIYFVAGSLSKQATKQIEKKTP